MCIAPHVCSNNQLRFVVFFHLSGSPQGAFSVLPVCKGCVPSFARTYLYKTLNAQKYNEEKKNLMMEYKTLEIMK